MVAGRTINMYDGTDDAAQVFGTLLGIIHITVGAAQSGSEAYGRLDLTDKSPPDPLPTASRPPPDPPLAVIGPEE
eukprot:781273-Prorocentrum_minimum.AAC.1